MNKLIMSEANISVKNIDDLIRDIKSISLKYGYQKVKIYWPEKGYKLLDYYINLCGHGNLKKVKNRYIGVSHYKNPTKGIVFKING